MIAKPIYSSFKLFKLALLAIFIIITFLLSVGCSNNTDTNQEAAKALKEYFVDDLHGYNGDNQYYHVAQNIENSEDHEIKQIISGEVFNQDKGSNSSDYHFTQTYEIINDKMTLSNDGEKLNDTDYDTEIILSFPLVEGNTWTFSAHRDGKKVSVTAEITSIADDQITVKYKDKNEYEEIRVLKMGKGTTDFYKYYQYDGLVVVTGYHLDENFVFQNIVHDAETVSFDNLISLRIPYRLHELITQYNLAFEQFVNSGSEDVFQFIDGESDYRDVLLNLDKINQEIDFIGFKVTKYNTSQKIQKLYVTEAYFQGDVYKVTDMVYEVILNDKDYLIWDAYPNSN